ALRLEQAEEHANVRGLRTGRLPQKAHAGYREVEHEVLAVILSEKFERRCFLILLEIVLETLPRGCAATRGEILDDASDERRSIRRIAAHGGTKTADVPGTGHGHFEEA